MNDNENRRHLTFVRVRDFGDAHSTDFADGSIGKDLFTRLASIVNELDSHAAAEVSGQGTARQGTSTRAIARIALREDLEAIRRTARAMSKDVAGIDNKFRVPRNENDQLLLNAARATATDAPPLRAQFIARELHPDFLDDLNANISALEAAISGQASGVGDHVAARAAIDDSVSSGIETVRELDAIVKNKYANDPSTLAEWASASHTERAPRRKAHLRQSPSPSAEPSNTQPPA